MRPSYCTRAKPRSDGSLYAHADFSSPAAPASSARTSSTTSCEHTDDQVTVLDKLTYAGNRASLDGLPEDRFAFVEGDITDAATRRRARRGHDVRRALRRRVAQRQLAARPAPFLRHEHRRHVHAARGRPRARHQRFHHISTDEVYGDLELDDPERFTENTPYNPSSPYSSTKAGSDLLVRAWVRSFGVQATITNCSNNYGPYQHVEKFIPRQITNVIGGDPPEALRRRARTCATGSTPTTTPRRC